MIRLRTKLPSLIQIILAFPIICCSTASAHNVEAKRLLHEAQAHLKVLPGKTLQILQSHASKTAELEIADQIRWHLTALSAGIFLNEQQSIEKAIDQLLVFRTNQAFAPYMDDIMNGIGIWMRRNGHLQEAKISYLCSFAHASERKKKIQALYNLAGLERTQNNLAQAQKLNAFLRNIAQQQNNPLMLATSLNNLAVIALAQNRLDSAANYFKQAMDMNQINKRRSSELLNGLNLLHTFLRQNDDKMFDRLYPRVKRLLSKYPSSSRTAYLNFIYRAYLAKHDSNLEESERFKLMEHFKKIKDVGIQSLLIPLAQELKIEIQITNKQPRRYQGTWPQYLQTCDWGLSEEVNYAELLENIQQTKD